MTTQEATRRGLVLISMDGKQFWRTPQSIAEDRRAAMSRTATVHELVCYAELWAHESWYAPIPELIKATRFREVVRILKANGK